MFFSRSQEHRRVRKGRSANPRHRTLRDAKRMGFSDKFIGQLWGLSAEDVPTGWREHNIFPVEVDDRHLRERVLLLCAVFLFHFSEQENESIVSEREKIVVLGSGTDPHRAGRREFDYSTVHAIWSIRAAGYEAIIINNNPGNRFDGLYHQRQSSISSR